MKKSANQYDLLYSPQFILGLALLLLNDLLLKPQFHNWFTGKLSDVVGLYIFPLLWCAFFPVYKKHIYWLTALVFALWKSSLSQPLIDAGIPFNRVVDMSDLWALMVLPVSYVCMASPLPSPKGEGVIMSTLSRGLVMTLISHGVKNVRPAIMTILALLVFCNDSLPYRMIGPKSQHFYKKKFKTKLTKVQLFARLDSAGVKYYRDSVFYSRYYYDTSQFAVQKIQDPGVRVMHFWRIKNYVAGHDTIKNIDFDFYSTPPKNKLMVTGYDIDTLSWMGNVRAFNEQERKYDKVIRKSLKGLVR